VVGDGAGDAAQVTGAVVDDEDLVHAGIVSGVWRPAEASVCQLL
jgi:hypothetical protein